MSHRRHILEAMRQMRLAVTDKGYVSKDLVNECGEKIGFIHRANTSVTYFAGVNDKGEVSHESNQACHAGLSYHRHKGTIKFIVSRIQFESNPNWKKIPKEVFVSFFDWLTLHSPYADAFVYGGGERTFRRGFVIAKTDVPSNLLAGAMFAHRMATEHYSRIMLAWYEMQQRGVHPSIAFCFAHYFAIGSEGVVKAGALTWHVPLPGGNMNKSFISNFKNKTLVNPNSNYVENKSYYPVHSLWGRDGDGYLNGEINDLLNNVEREVVKSDGPKNPFAAGQRMKQRTPVGPFFDRLSPIIIEAFGEDNK